MTAAAPLPSPRLLGEAPLQEIRTALAGPGLRFDYGAATLRLRSDSPALAAQLRCVYHAFTFIPDAAWADLHVRIERPRSLRRWLGAQVLFLSDGRQPFEPFPGDSPLPLLEWGVNWLLGQRLNDLLLLHAGAVARDGVALLLPALPGSGKSTLTAALALSGWRLLSDEFGAYDVARHAFVPVLKPIALKNESIDVVRRLAPHARLGPMFPKTRKGTVAHLAVAADAVARSGEPARPGLFVLPRWVQGSATRLERVSQDRLFSALAFNAFNYTTLGIAGFDAVLDLTRTCPAWTLVYSDLEDALRAIDHCWQHVVAPSCVAAVHAHA